MVKKDMAALHLKRRHRLNSAGQTGLIVGLLVLGLFVASVFYFGGDSVIAPGTDPFVSGTQPGPGSRDGASIFATTCAPCHGVGGVGNPAANFPPLNSTGSAWMKTSAEIEAIILDGGHIMPGQRGLVSDEEVQRLLEYLQSLWTEEQRQSFQSAGN